EAAFRSSEQPLGQAAKGGGGAAERQALTSVLRGRVRQEAGFGDEGVPIILDENIAGRGVAEALRARGFNVRDVFEIFGGGGVPDADIARVAETIGGRVLTQNVRDFAPAIRVRTPARGGVNVDLFEQILQNTGLRVAR